MVQKNDSTTARQHDGTKERKSDGAMGPHHERAILQNHRFLF